MNAHAARAGRTGDHAALAVDIDDGWPDASIGRMAILLNRLLRDIGVQQVAVIG